ncbi:hypothetical protein KR018_008929 [Drosophila ironensis]|nr:hypothetical protein KR018_008929 [Drosophila ironensis]
MGATMVKPLVKNGNLLDSLPSQGTLHVVMLGLDSAGKTTALYRLKFDQYLNTVPTIGFNCEKVQGTVGKAKGVHFLVWDVGGQEKLRPLWRSYTRYYGHTEFNKMYLKIYFQFRCTDGILFVIDSVDTERMEEAKMELMRTAKCPDNQGVPVLILANKQDLPNACGAMELENLLGLNELHNVPKTLMITSSPSSNNLIGCSISHQTNLNKSPTMQTASTIYSHVEHGIPEDNHSKISGAILQPRFHKEFSRLHQPSQDEGTVHNKTNNVAPTHSLQLKGWYIQPTCAITGEGLQEGLNALYDMILKRRKLNKSHKKRR